MPIWIRLSPYSPGDLETGLLIVWIQIGGTCPADWTFTDPARHEGPGSAGLVNLPLGARHTAPGSER